MKTGTIIKNFFANDGRKVILRTLKWEDLDDCLEFINSLVEEGADITVFQKVTREYEIDWLSKQLAEVEKGNTFIVVAEVGGKLVANSSITKKTGYSKHVGVLGISIKDGYRDIGIGTEMMNTLISKGKEMGLKIITLTVFSSNSRAKHVYEKVGFRETGRIPKEIYKNGEFIDHIFMVKELTS
ncbi:GNAT family N-acetyltransferase [Candidatus Bathyarchaeota archaeon]|nr:GNAT family N-acetyltransferase [Candidatus Bathyarchaeota archaeon]